MEVSHEWPLPNVLDNSGNRSIFIESPIADSAKGCSASSELELVLTTIRSGCPTRQFGRRHWPHWRDRPSALAMSNGRSMVISSPLKEHFNVFSFTSVFFLLRERTRHVCKATHIILFKQLIKFTWHFLLWLKLCDSEMVKMCIKFSLFKGKISSHIQDSFHIIRL